MVEVILAGEGHKALRERKQNVMTGRKPSFRSVGRSLSDRCQ